MFLRCADSQPTSRVCQDLTFIADPLEGSVLPTIRRNAPPFKRDAYSFRGSSSCISLTLPFTSVADCSQKGVALPCLADISPRFRACTASGLATAQVIRAPLPDVSVHRAAIGSANPEEF